MANKEMYLVPEVEEIILSFEETLLNGSTTGFTDDPDYNGNHWGLN